MIRPLWNPRAIVFIFMLINPQVFPQAESLSVEQAVEEGLKKAIQLKLKRAELRQADHGVRGARSALFPTAVLETTASYLTHPTEAIIVEAGALGDGMMTGSFDPGTGPVPFVAQLPPLPEDPVTVFEEAEHTYFQLKATLTQPLYTWGKLRNAVAVASLERQIRGEELEQSRRKLIHDIRQAYFSAQLTELSVQILQKVAGIMEDVVADREQSYGEGLINLEMLYQVKADLAGVRRRVLAAKEQSRTARYTLNLLTGLNLRQATLVSGFREALPELDEGALQTAVLQSAPELRILKAQIEQAQRNMKIEKAKFPLVPDFSLNLGLDITGQKIPGVQNEWLDTWDLNFTVSVGARTNLFDSGRSLWKIKQAEEQVEMVRLGTRQLQDLLSLQVREAVQEARIAYFTLQENRQRLTVSEEQDKNAQVSYENELITREQRGQAKISLYSQQLEILRTRFRLEMALTKLEFFSGSKL